MHDLFAGNVFYFLGKYGSFYRFSQQGWEHVMGLIKRTFHHSNQKGGGRGNKSKLKPLVYTVLRKLLWDYGDGDEFFTNNV